MGVRRSVRQNFFGGKILVKENCIWEKLVHQKLAAPSDGLPFCDGSLLKFFDPGGVGSIFFAQAGSGYPSLV